MISAIIFVVVGLIYGWFNALITYGCLVVICILIGGE